MNQSTASEIIAALMVKARTEGHDLADIMASAIYLASVELGGAFALIEGRPGSWESDHLYNFAISAGAEH